MPPFLVLCLRQDLEEALGSKREEMQAGLAKKIDALAALLAEHLTSVGSPRSQIRAAQRLQQQVFATTTVASDNGTSKGNVHQSTTSRSAARRNNAPDRRVHGTTLN